jgi:glycosyltransferase involved in cell wall biosynthesis
MREVARRILVVLRRQASSVGDGADHRSYQILSDLDNCALNAEKIVITGADVQRTERATATEGGWKGYWSELRRREELLFHTVQVGASPDRLFLDLFRSYSRMHPYFALDDGAFVSILKEHAPLDLCVVDDVRFSEIIRINADHKIPTWIVPHNLETFDSHAFIKDRTQQTLRFLVRLQQELEALAACAERLMISRAEAWVMNGLEMPAHFYPYVPVSEIRDAMVEIRDARQKGHPRPGNFIMIGTVNHSTTEHGLDWFLRNWAERGLDDRFRVVVVGKGTERYRERYAGVPGLEFRGWIGQANLVEHLSLARAALAPQLMGFGALTRITEFACAGVPLLVSEHAAQSVDLPPGIIAIANSWDAWLEAMRQVEGETTDVSPDWSAYKAWEGRQPNPLKTLLSSDGNRL